MSLMKRNAKLNSTNSRVALMTRGKRRIWGCILPIRQLEKSKQFPNYLPRQRRVTQGKEDPTQRDEVKCEQYTTDREYRSKSIVLPGVRITSPDELTPAVLQEQPNTMPESP